MPQNKKNIFFNEKGNFAFVFFFIVFMITATMLFVLFTPIAQRFTIVSYRMGEQLIDSSQDDLTDFTDVSFKEDVNAILQGQKDNYAFQIDLMGSLNKYSGVIILVLGAISLVLLTRTVVQRNTGVV